MKKGGQVGAELHGQCDWEFGGQVDGIIHSTEATTSYTCLHFI